MKEKFFITFIQFCLFFLLINPSYAVFWEPDDNSSKSSKSTTKEETEETNELEPSGSSNKIDADILVDKLTKLKELFDAGLITQQEYSDKKKELLAEF